MLDSFYFIDMVYKVEGGFIMNVNRSFEEMLKSILLDTEDTFETTEEKYEKAKKKLEKLNVQSPELLFDHIKIGEQRGVVERKIKLFQARLNALTACEAYFELLAEEYSIETSKLNTTISQLEDDLNSKN